VNDVVPTVLALFKVLTTPLVHQATHIHNINPPPESAACGVSKLCHWSKPAEPTTLTLTLALTLTHSHSHISHSHSHTHIRTHYLHLRCHVTTAIGLVVLLRLIESRSHVSAYIITRYSAISQLKGVRCTDMGIHIDSYWCWWQIFQIFHFHFHCFKLLHHWWSYF
jgi:hypothetical protein